MSDRDFYKRYRPNTTKYLSDKVLKRIREGKVTIPLLEPGAVGAGKVVLPNFVNNTEEINE